MAYLTCEDGQITFTGLPGEETDLGVYQCSTGWVVDNNDPSFEPAEDLDPILIANAIAVGFFVLMPLWAAVSGGRILINAIRES